MDVEAGKANMVEKDLKDESVRGTLPLFKLRSKQDREQWRKLAFPIPETVQAGQQVNRCNF